MCADKVLAFDDRASALIGFGCCGLGDRAFARSLGRTLRRWEHRIAAGHQLHVSNGPTEAAKNLIKRIKRVAFGFTRVRNYPYGCCSPPTTPTGTYSPPSHPAEFEQPIIAWPACSVIHAPITSASRQGAALPPAEIHKPSHLAAYDLISLAIQRQAQPPRGCIDQLLKFAPDYRHRAIIYVIGLPQQSSARTGAYDGYLMLDGSN